MSANPNARRLQLILVSSPEQAVKLASLVSEYSPRHLEEWLQLQGLPAVPVKGQGSVEDRLLIAGRRHAALNQLFEPGRDPDGVVYLDNYKVGQTWNEFWNSQPGFPPRTPFLFGHIWAEVEGDQLAYAMSIGKPQARS